MWLRYRSWRHTASLTTSLFKSSTTRHFMNVSSCCWWRHTTTSPLWSGRLRIYSGNRVWMNDCFMEGHSRDFPHASMLTESAFRSVEKKRMKNVLQFWIIRNYVYNHHLRKRQWENIKRITFPRSKTTVSPLFWWSFVFVCQNYENNATTHINGRLELRETWRAKLSKVENMPNSHHSRCHSLIHHLCAMQSSCALATQAVKKNSFQRLETAPFCLFCPYCLPIWLLVFWRVHSA